MAITTCPSCRGKMSNKMRICPHCSYSVSAGDNQNDRVLHRLTRQKKRSLVIQAYMAVILFAVGCFCVYWGQQNTDTTILLTVAREGSAYLLAAGFFWYLVSRVRLFVLKKAH